MLRILLTFYSMMIVDADDGAGKGENLAEGGEDTGVDDAGGRHDEGGNQEKDTECYQGDGGV